MHQASRGPLNGTVSAQKALQGSEKVTRRRRGSCWEERKRNLLKIVLGIRPWAAIAPILVLPTQFLRVQVIVDQILHAKWLFLLSHSLCDTFILSALQLLVGKGQVEVCETFVVFGLVVALGAGVSGFHPATKNLVHNGRETIAAPGQTSRLSLEEAKGAVSKEFCPEKLVCHFYIKTRQTTVRIVSSHFRAPWCKESLFYYSAEISKIV